jgi:ribosome-associated toxin RatA of RatAB toxin-antitoxin module
MTVLHNEIIINAPITKIWDALSNVEELYKYDPTVKESEAISSEKSGKGAKRRVLMKKKGNWFEETCTISKQNEELSYELTACSFPVQNLVHSYTFEKIGNKTKVKQIMTYKMKYGLIGKLLDKLLVRKESNNGIKIFMAGLKTFTEKNNT